jgi:hypothetical protein
MTTTSVEKTSGLEPEVVVNSVHTNKESEE